MEILKLLLLRLAVKAAAIRSTDDGINFLARVEDMDVLANASTPSPAPIMGLVDELFAFAPPSSASPALRNPLNASGCWPGIRIYNTQKEWLIGTKVDMVAFIAQAFWYYHPYMDLLTIDVKTHKVKRRPCGEATTKGPMGRPSFIIHLPYVYKHWSGPFLPGRLAEISNVGVIASYELVTKNARDHARKYGWRLLATSHDAGGWADGGSQVQHLIQHPKSLECILTFKGSIGVRDWVSNVQLRAKHFCGLVDKDETCGRFGKCKTRGGSFVHGGFRDHMRRMTRTVNFQRDIRLKLGFCSKLNVVGHSLGAATAELFTACLAHAPKPGEYGFEEDYKYLSYVKQSPKLMPEKAVSEG